MLRQSSIMRMPPCFLATKDPDLAGSTHGELHQPDTKDSFDKPDVGALMTAQDGIHVRGCGPKRAFQLCHLLGRPQHALFEVLQHLQLRGARDLSEERRATHALWDAQTPVSE